MPAGRPTKLTKEAIEQAKDYINGGYEHAGDAIPSMVGMAALLDVVTQTLYNWGEANEEFLGILEKCNERQQQVLLNGGLLGDLNPTITKLVLGKHGYHERQEVTGKDGQPVKMEQKVSNVTFTGPDGD